MNPTLAHSMSSLFCTVWCIILYIFCTVWCIILYIFCTVWCIILYIFCTVWCIILYIFCTVWCIILYYTSRVWCIILYYISRVWCIILYISCMVHHTIHLVYGASYYTSCACSIYHLRNPKCTVRENKPEQVPIRCRRQKHRATNTN